ncbi:MAG TPA: phosphocholine cytidylyltransferase family protein [Candidatus Binatia bacterium]|nr:phosphocholine cytidylyltransferase family protein [Candidatus Binatia bacterium]
MRAIILNAGQGRRLLPLTADRPKCLLTLHGPTILESQLQALASAGVEEAVIVVGFGAAQVEAELRRVCPPGLRGVTVHNPLFDRSDNLVSCLSARSEMTQQFLLLNGDTLFQPGVIGRLLDSTPSPVSIAVACKEGYDHDDMKVQWRRGGQVQRIGKDLPPDIVDGEAIGVSLFRGKGPDMFLDALDEVVRRPGGQGRWYLSAIDLLAGQGHVQGVNIDGFRWMEIDTPHDLARAREQMPLWADVPSIAVEPLQAELESI